MPFARGFVEASVHLRGSWRWEALIVGNMKGYKAPFSPLTLEVASASATASAGETRKKAEGKLNVAGISSHSH